MHNRVCRIWEENGLDCPFAPFLDKDTPEEDRHDDPERLMVPARRERDRVQGTVNAIFQNAFEPEHMQRGLRRAAIMQGRGELSSIPNLARVIDLAKFDRFKLTGRGHEAIMAALAAIAIMTVSRAMQRTGFGSGLVQGMTSTQRVAGQLNKLGKGVARVHNPSRGRVGGFIVNDAARLKALFNMPLRRRFEGKTFVQSGPPGGGPK